MALNPIEDLKVWLGRQVVSPKGGTGVITQVSECGDVVGVDRRTIQGIQVDGVWYSVDQIVKLNPVLVQPEDEDWVS